MSRLFAPKVKVMLEICLVLLSLKLVLVQFSILGLWIPYVKEKVYEEMLCGIFRSLDFSFITTGYRKWDLSRCSTFWHVISRLRTAVGLPVILGRMLPNG